MKAFVVTGETGEYSDRSNWIVAVYFDEMRALARVEECMKAAADLIAAGWYSIDPAGHYCTNNKDVDDDIYDADDPRWPRSPFDEKLKLTYGEIKYGYETVEVADPPDWLRN